MLTALFAAAALMQAAPAAAPAAPAAVTQAPAAHVTTSTVVVHTKEAMVCHDEVLVGSRFTKKVCAPKKDVEERKRLDREQVDQWQANNPEHVN